MFCYGGLAAFHTWLKPVFLGICWVGFCKGPSVYEGSLSKTFSPQILASFLSSFSQKPINIFIHFLLKYSLAPCSVSSPVTRCQSWMGDSCVLPSEVCIIQLGAGEPSTGGPHGALWGAEGTQVEGMHPSLPRGTAFNSSLLKRERHHCRSLARSTETLPRCHVTLGGRGKQCRKGVCVAKKSKRKNRETKGVSRRASKQRKDNWPPDLKNEEWKDLVEEAGRHVLRGLAHRRSGGLGLGVRGGLLLSSRLGHLTGGAWKGRVLSRLLGLCTCHDFVCSLLFVVGSGLDDDRRDDLLLGKGKCGGPSETLSLPHPPWLPGSPPCSFPKPDVGFLALGPSALQDLPPFSLSWERYPSWDEFLDPWTITQFGKSEVSVQTGRRDRRLQGGGGVMAGGGDSPERKCCGTPRRGGHSCPGPFALLPESHGTPGEPETTLSVKMWPLLADYGQSHTPGTVSGIMTPANHSNPLLSGTIDQRVKTSPLCFDKGESKEGEGDLTHIRKV